MCMVELSVVFRNFRRGYPQEEKGFDPMWPAGPTASIKRVHSMTNLNNAREDDFPARQALSGGECETHTT
jgi:hypothetical protein